MDRVVLRGRSGRTGPPGLLWTVAREYLSSYSLALVSHPAGLDLERLKELQKSLRGLNRQALLNHSERHTLLVAQMSDISFL